MTGKRESPFPFIIRSSRFAAAPRVPPNARKASISQTGGRFNYGGAGYRKARGNEANALQILVHSNPCSFRSDENATGNRRPRFYRPRRFEL